MKKKIHLKLIKQHEFHGTIFSSTVYRKLVATEVKEKITNPRQRQIVAQAMGILLTQSNNIIIWNAQQLVQKCRFLKHGH